MSNSPNQPTSETTRFGAAESLGSPPPNFDADATRVDVEGEADSTSVGEDVTRLDEWGGEAGAPDATRLAAGESLTWAGHQDPQATRVTAHGLASSEVEESQPGEATVMGTVVPGAPPAHDPDSTFLTYEGEAGPLPAALPSPPRVSLEVGEVVDGYQIEAILGEGGMGTVFAVLDPRTGARYALKTLALHASSAMRDRFVREGHAVARIGHHPNVVGVHRAGEIDGRLYLVMDLVHGGDLKGRIARQGPLDWSSACALVAALCSGAAAAHGQGVLHRDLKPANVMFDELGNPKLVDFGIARVVGEHSLTQTTAFMGSPPFMPPELADQRPKDADERSDVYGLGAILYYALTGRAPFAGSSALAIARQVLDAPVPQPSAVSAEIPPSVDAIVLRAMAKEPAERYSSVEDLRAALLAAAAGEGAGPSRIPLLLTVGLLTLGLLVVGLLVATQPFAEIEQAASSAAPSARESSGRASPSAPQRRITAALVEAVGGRASARRLHAYEELCQRFEGLEGRERRDARRLLKRLPGELLHTFPPGLADAEPLALGPGRWVVRYKSKARHNPIYALEVLGQGARKVSMHRARPRVWALYPNDPAGPSVFFLEPSGALVWVGLDGKLRGPGREPVAWRPPAGVEPTPRSGDRPQRLWQCLAVSPDGTALAVGGTFKRVRILALPSLKPLALTDERPRATFALGWSPSGQRLISTTGSPPQGDSSRLGSYHMGELNTVTVWSRSGAKVWERGPGVLSMTAAFLDEERVVAGSDDHSVCVYRLEKGSEPTYYGSGRGLGGLRTADHQRSVSTVQSLDDERFLSATLHWNCSVERPNQIGVWAIDSPRKPLVWVSTPEHITAARPGWEGRTLLVGYADGRVEVLATPRLP